jgi:hypothetical protein
MKHVEFVPAAAAVTSEILMSTGTVLESVSPEPNWPLAFEPQHCTVASSITAHAKSLPAATDETPEVKPETCTGYVLEVVELFPNCPTSFLPQHFTPPSATAHVKPKPALTELTLASGEDTAETG